MTFSSALVTGANGFLGRALVRRLQASGRRVTALVRRSDNLVDGVEPVIADIRDPAAAHLALGGYRIDVVFHLAAAGVAPSDREPTRMFATNAAATGTFAATCAHAGVRGFVYAGSCAEYEAASTGEPVSEDQPFTRTHLYGASKAAGGLWGTAVARSCAMTFCWLRFFGIYGPGETADRLIPYLAKRLQRDTPVDLTPGGQIRDLTFVDDAVDALLLAGDQAMRGQEGPFNVCSGIGTAVHEIACRVADSLHKPRELLRFGARPYRSDEPMWLVGDPTRFRQLTGYSPRIDLDLGTRLTLESRGLDQ